MPLFLVDVSKYQEPADWPRVIASGVSGVIARASIGTVGDTAYRGHVTNAKRAGMPFIGAYHYLYPRSWVSPEAQADKFLSVVGDTLAHAVALDTEYSRSKPYIDAEDVRRFTERVHAKLPGFAVLQYAPRWYVRGYMGNPNLSSNGPLWQSHYVSTRGLSPQQLYALVPSSWWTADWGGWTKVSLLQFTSGAKVPGFADLVDCSAFRGSLADLYALARPLPDTALETPKMIFVPQGTPIGSLVFNGTGHALFTPDRRFAKVADGFTRDVYAKVVLAQPLDDAPGDRRTAYLVSYDGEAYFALDVDVTFTATADATPYSQKQYDARFADGVAAGIKLVAEKVSAAILGLNT